MLIATSLNITVRRFSEASVMPRLARAGFGGVDFNFCDNLQREDWTRPDSGNAWVDEMAQAAAAAGLKWVQAHGPMFSPGCEAQTEHGLKLCQTSIRLCGRLGVPWMVLHPNTSPQPFDPADFKASIARDAAFFRKLLPDCQKANVGIAIENIRDDRFKTTPPNTKFRLGSVPEELCQLIDMLDHPLIGACWDTGHARLMDHNQKASLTMLGKRLKCLHIQENDGTKDAHLLPFCNGSGCVDWAGVMQGLRGIGYGGDFTYEAHNSFHPVPDALFDKALSYGAAIARYLIDDHARES